MIGEVGDFIDGLPLVAALAGHDDLGGLLADLFENFVDALLKEVGGVGALLFFCLAALKQGHQALQGEGLGELAVPQGVGEAGVAAQMAGRAVLEDLHGQGVAVAVGGDGDDMLDVAAGLALAPELLAGTAEEAGASLADGYLQTLPVHIGQRQDLLGLGIHHNGGNQALFVEFQLVNINHG